MGSPFSVPTLKYVNAMFYRIESNDSEFDKYRRNWKVHVHHDCGRECRINDVCGMLESSYDKHRECFRDKNVTFGFSTISTIVGSDAPVHTLGTTFWSLAGVFILSSGPYQF